MRRFKDFKLSLTPNFQSYVLFLLLFSLPFVSASAQEFQNKAVFDRYIKTNFELLKKGQGGTVLENIRKSRTDASLQVEPEALRVVNLVMEADALGVSMDKANLTSRQLFEQAIALSVKSKVKGLEVFARVSYAFYLYNYDKVRESYPYFMAAISDVNQMDAEQLLIPVDTYSQIGYFLSYLKDYRGAEVLLKKSVAISDPRAAETAKIYDNLGRTFFELGKTSDAESAYFMAMDIARRHNDSLRMAKIYGNQSLMYSAKGRYDQAIDLLEEDLKISRGINNKNTVYVLTLLGKIYLKTNQLDLAREAFNEAFDLTKGRLRLTNSAYVLAGMLKEIAAKTSNDPMELMMVKRMDSIKTSKYYVDENETLTTLNWMMAKSNYETKLKQQKLQSTETTFRNTMIFVGILFIVILSYIGIAYYVLRQKNQFTSVVQEFKLKQLTSENKLNKAKSSLSSYLTFLIEKNEQVRDLQTELKKLEGKVLPGVKSEKRELYTLLQGHLATDDRWLEFKNVFRKTYPDYYDYVTSQYSTLTESNIRLILLTKLGIGNKEMANLLGVSEGAIRKAKSRLQSKLGNLSADILKPFEVGVSNENV